MAGLPKSNLVTVGSLKERRQIIKVDHMPVSILNSPAALLGGLEISRKDTLWNAYTGIHSRNGKSSLSKYRALITMPDRLVIVYQRLQNNSRAFRYQMLF